ncbi:recombinase family protein [Rugosibacter aromaticivorans]|uniref:recombinase family protein n=1 Tax=Rugosibacter aromaticivorans TaxID=1565605 RepID=UPI00192A24AC|nr:recombinase family protein [Rugosibacter aromaticivorans]
MDIQCADIPDGRGREHKKRLSVSFLSLTEVIDTKSPVGRMMMQIIGAFAAFERELIREITRADPRNNSSWNGSSPRARRKVWAAIRLSRVRAPEDATPVVQRKIYQNVIGQSLRRAYIEHQTRDQTASRETATKTDTRKRIKQRRNA